VDAIKCIKTRRSIRDYSEKKVSDSAIKQILSCAMQAPSACNEQPWEFIVVKDRELLGKIPSLSTYAAMAKKAPLAIIVCMNPKKEYPFIKGYSIQDCSAATQNILLAVNALGLGAVWTGIKPDETKKIERIREVFDIPDYIIPLAIIPIGYPKNKSKPANRFKKEKVHYEKW
jgi:nitroreductase